MKHEQIMNTGYAAARPNAVIEISVEYTFLYDAVSLLFADRVKVAADVLVHLEHVYLGLLEDCLHLVVAYDLTLVLWILKIVGFDMLPELLDHLRSG